MTAILVGLVALEEPASFAIVVTVISSVDQNVGRDGIVLVESGSTLRSEMVFLYMYVRSKVILYV